MIHAQSYNDDDALRLDLGEGPSTPSLHTSIRVRPITIRFTEPGVRDLHLRLHSVTSLRALSHSTSNSTGEQQQPQQQAGGLIFDFEAEQHPDTSPAPSPPPPQPPQPPLVAASAQPLDGSKAEGARNLVHEVFDVLNADGLMGDESVRSLKAKMERHRQGVQSRRLRLIHAGRILMDGVRLVGYLEELDARTRVQSRQTFRQLALDADGQKAGEGEESDEDSEEQEQGRRSGAADEEDGTVQRDAVEKREMSVRELVDWLSAQAEEPATDATSGGDSCSTLNARHTGGKGKKREPACYSELVRVAIRTAPTVYIQCSVGERITQPSPTSPHGTTHSADPTDVHGATGAPPLDSSSTSSLTAEDEDDRNRGFNRLLDAGLTPEEISTIRTQFRTSHPLATTYDLIQAREHAQHLLAMEESWMDTFSSPNPTAGGAAAAAHDPVAGGGDFGDAPGGASRAYSTVMQGLMVGFFLPPLVPLFWFRDKPHPSSLPRGGEPREAEDDEDDEQQWENERSAMTRESVLGSTMQISILFGLVANLIMGVFRFIW
ncbi:hypothetical protein EX895_005301 [Sporisorium graminicola]|uniref:Ubiquitin-like domain-containing protein n=1 Tax=Sporisorium graminicola TaxID=280036 RepID=A0A4U7KN67_9BASI|nr:hypothetical protein EX895_005301 [Sporisorium graminicola]TKY85761.1 hypothetical protein EX895_005301 [Sporisorium graminicola]